MAQTNKRDNRVIAVVLLVAAALVAVGGISSYAAKYAHQATDGRDLSSPAFYFTSDVLRDDDTANYQLPVGTTSISFELRNYVDDLRWCDTNIDYEYKVAAPDGTQFASGAGVITRDASKGVAVPISATGLTQPGTYTVTATSTKPFSQTLSAKFTIAAADTNLNISLADAANSATATLTVSTQDYEGNFTVSWPADVIPDQTQTEFTDVNTGNSSGSYSAGSVSVTAKKFSTYTFRFFKTDPSKSYTTDQITAVKAQ